MSLTFPEFKYYYLGFYIHDNEKMAYKGNFILYIKAIMVHSNFYVQLHTILLL